MEAARRAGSTAGRKEQDAVGAYLRVPESFHDGREWTSKWSNKRRRGGNAAWFGCEISVLRVKSGASIRVNRQSCSHRCAREYNVVNTTKGTGTPHASCGRAHCLECVAALSWCGQYAHTAWTIRDGFLKGGVRSIAQTSDGYLWLVTEFGLVRFDGVRAVPWTPPSGQSLPSTNIRSLLAARDGTLWIGTLEGEQATRDVITNALKAASGRIAGKGGAAERLGLKRTTLQNKMNKLGISRISF